MRNPKITPFMVGLIQLPENETNLERINGAPRKGAIRGRATERDPWYDPREAPDPFGIILWVSSLKFPLANQVFTPQELNERIEMHSRRVKEEETRLEEGLAKHKKTRCASNGKGNHIAEWMRVVNCSRCKRVLIALDQPELNDSPYEAVVARRHERLAKCVKTFGVPAKEVRETVKLENGSPVFHRAWLCKSCAED